MDKSYKLFLDHNIEITWILEKSSFFMISWSFMEEALPQFVLWLAQLQTVNLEFKKPSNLEFHMDKCTQPENEGVKSLHAVL